MTNYPLLTETSLTADWAVTNHTDYLGYKLLGWVISLSSILPTPSLDHSASPGGQTCSPFLLSGSIAPVQATLWHGEWFFLFYFILMLMLATSPQPCPPALCPHLSVLTPTNPHTPAYPCVLSCIHLPACAPCLLTCTWPCLTTPVVAAPACLPPQWVWWVVISFFTLFLCSHFQSTHICVPVLCAHTCLCSPADLHLIMPGHTCCGCPCLPASAMNLVSSLYIFYFILMFMFPICPHLCPCAHVCVPCIFHEPIYWPPQPWLY